MVLALGTVAFVSTNVDGLVVLTVFCADSDFRAAQVVAGQLLATTAWVAVSALAALAAVVIPTRWLGLVGLLPILLGLIQFKALRDEGWGGGNDAPDEPLQSYSVKQTPSRIGAVALVVLAKGADNIAV